MTKVARCSTREAIAVDALSKGDFGTFFKESPQSGPEPLRIPSTLVRWLSAPVVDYSLGKKILMEWKEGGIGIL